MRKLFTLVLLGFALGLSACTSYDDTSLWDKINDHEDRISRLEEMCREMNTNITALQQLIEAMECGDYIKNVTPITEDGKTIGYTITFAKNGPITIYHGEDGIDGERGEDGLDGHTPQIGVKQDTDGIYYWTIDGEWLTDEDGNRVKAVGIDGTDGTEGVDGITPQLKIEDNYWFVSYDNGNTWTQLGKATGEDGKDGEDGSSESDGDSIFAGVDTSNPDYVIFTLSDGSRIKLPTWYTYEKLQILCNEMNTNIEALQTIVKALQNNDYIDGIAPLYDNGVEVGYTIAFAKSGPITIYHGKDGIDGERGEDGLDGYTPQIGVKQDTDGIYYWTIDGEWLTDEDGNRVKAVGIDGTDGTEGVDGITPQLKIEDNYWFISYDNGNTWTQLGKATGEDGKDGEDGSSASDGDSIFASVDIKEDGVVFYLSDGSTFTVPINAQTESDIINFLDNGVKIRCVLNWDTDGDNQLSKSEAAAVTSLDKIFSGENIIAFDELKYFTGLTSIEDEAFSGCVSLVAITLPETITHIGDFAFEYCVKLKTITIPNSVVTISDSSFYNCQSLKSVTLPDDFEFVETKIDQRDGWEKYEGICNAFIDCYSLEAFYGGNTSNDNRCIIIDNNLISVALGGLTSYTIPEGVTSICEYACCFNYYFQDYSIGYTTLTIPSSVTNIGYYGVRAHELHFMSQDPPTLYDSHWWWGDIEVIYVPEGAFGNYITSDWPKDIIKNIYFNVSEFDPNQLIIYKYNTDSDNLPKVNNSLNGYIADSQSDGIGYILFNEPVKEINSNIFTYPYRSNVIDITLPQSLKVLGEKALYECSGLKTITLPNSLTTIGKDAFHMCSGLTEVNMPDSLTKIGESAFYGCSAITQIAIPYCVTYIGATAFWSCFIEKVWCLPTTPPSLGGSVFDYYNVPTIYVPYDAYEDYKESIAWSQWFKNIFWFKYPSEEPEENPTPDTGELIPVKIDAHREESWNLGNFVLDIYIDDNLYHSIDMLDRVNANEEYLSAGQYSYADGTITSLSNLIYDTETGERAKLSDSEIELTHNEDGSSTIKGYFESEYGHRYDIDWTGVVSGFDLPFVVPEPISFEPVKVWAYRESYWDLGNFSLDLYINDNQYHSLDMQDNVDPNDKYLSAGEYSYEAGTIASWSNIIYDVDSGESAYLTDAVIELTHNEDGTSTIKGYFESNYGHHYDIDWTGVVVGFDFSTEDPEPQPGEDVEFTATYFGGEYYNVGNHNYYIVISDAEVTGSEAVDGATYYYFDLYSNDVNDDRSVPNGVYTFDASNAYVSGTFTEEYGFGFKVNGSERTRYFYDEGSTVTVSDNKIVAELILTDGSKHVVTYEGSLALAEESEGGSGLTGDLELNEKGWDVIVENYGQYYSDETDNYLVSLCEDADSGSGKLFTLDLLADCATCVDYSGTFTGSDSLGINTFITGNIEDGDLLGSWYAEIEGGYVSGVMAPLMEGTITVTLNADGTETYTFDCKDDQGHKITGAVTANSYLTGYALSKGAEKNSKTYTIQLPKRVVR